MSNVTLANLSALFKIGVGKRLARSEKKSGGRGCLPYFNCIINSLSAFVSFVSVFEVHYIMPFPPPFQMLILTVTVKDQFGFRHGETRALVGHDGHLNVPDTQEDLTIVRQLKRIHDAVGVSVTKRHHKTPRMVLEGSMLVRIVQTYGCDVVF